MYGSFFPRVTLSMASDAHLDLLSHCTQIMRGESPCACGSGAFRSTPSCNKRATNASFRCRTAQQIRLVCRPTPPGVGSSEKCASTRRGMRVTCVMQCVAVCCSVLQCVAVCCSVLQCVTVCCSVLQCVAVLCSALQCVAVRCNVLQCVAVCRSVLQCAAVCCSVLRCDVLQCVIVLKISVCEARHAHM